METALTVKHSGSGGGGSRRRQDPAPKKEKNGKFKQLYREGRLPFYSKNEYENLKRVQEGKYVLPQQCIRTYAQLEKIIEDYKKTGGKVPEYRPRNKEFPKTSRERKHIGQRKLTMAEMEFLVMAMDDIGPTEEDSIVFYVGAAPGFHLKLLVWLFPSISEWHLIDPVFDTNHHFHKIEEHEDNMTEQRENAKFRYANGVTVSDDDYFVRMLNKHFSVPEVVMHHNAVMTRIRTHPVTATEDTLTEIFKRLDLKNIGSAHERAELPHPIPEEEQPFVHLILISDIRAPYDENTPSEQIEASVKEDMRVQACWQGLLCPIATLFKFRLPYTDKTPYLYLDGDLMLPVWGCGATTELRLRLREGSTEQKMYYPEAVRDNMFFFNTAIREQMRYEGACELYILQKYLYTLQNSNAIKKHLIKGPFHGNSIANLSELITRILHDTEKHGDQLENFTDTREHRHKGKIQEYPDLPPYHLAPPVAMPMSLPVTLQVGRGNLYTGAAQETRNIWVDWYKRFIMKPVTTPGEWKQYLENVLVDGKWPNGDSLDEYPPKKPTCYVVAQYNKLDILKGLARDYDCDMAYISPKGDGSILSAAVYYGHFTMVEWLLGREDARRTLRLKNRAGETILETAMAGKDQWQFLKDNNVEYVEEGLKRDPFLMWYDATNEPKFDEIMVALKTALRGPTRQKP